VPEGAEGGRREGGRGAPAAQEVKKQSWSDKIIVSQDMQVRVKEWIVCRNPLQSVYYQVGLV